MSSTKKTCGTCGTYGASTPAPGSQAFGLGVLYVEDADAVFARPGCTSELRRAIDGHAVGAVNTEERRLDSSRVKSLNYACRWTVVVENRSPRRSRQTVTEITDDEVR